MLSPQDKGPIFNDMKCHCGVYSSFCVYLELSILADSKNVLF